MPPGSAKSTYASVLFVAWMAQFGWTILAASHSVSLAERWGRRVRNLVAEHGPGVLGCRLVGDNQAADNWSCDNGHEYRAAGSGTHIPGFRAKLGLIDDPVSGIEAADSELQRDKLWEWYINDFRPRLVPGARQICIQTRWHEDDLAGRLLQHGNWHVLSLPALAEDNDPLGRSPGQPLWSDDAYGFGAQLLDRAKDTPARTWSAQYQQRPAPEEGDYFKVAWLKYAEPPPRERMQVYGASDYAVTADGGNYTVHLVVGLGPDGRMYLLDLWRKQSASDEWVEAFCDLVRKWKPIGWAEETGQIKSGVGPFLDQRSRQRQAYVAREQFPTRGGDKAIRAQSIRGRMAIDGLYMGERDPWVADLRSELLHFPAAKNDDQVDALGLLGQLLDKMVPGSKAKEPEKPKFNDYKPRAPRDQSHPMVL